MEEGRAVGMGRDRVPEDHEVESDLEGDEDQMMAERLETVSLAEVLGDEDLLIEAYDDWVDSENADKGMIGLWRCMFMMPDGFALLGALVHRGGA